MEVEKMAEQVLARLADLGIEEVGSVEADIERERAYVAAFCGIAEVDGVLDDELCSICVELAAASVLERSAITDGGVKSLSMGDVSVVYGESGADSLRRMAENMYRKAIMRLAARRGIRW